MVYEKVKYFKIIFLTIFFLEANVCFSNQKTEINKVLDVEIVDAVSDKSGFIWLVTKNAFYKYDGSNLILIKEWSFTDFKPSKIKIIDKKIFISSNSHGLLSYDIANGKIKKISKQKGILDFYITKDKQYYLCTDKTLRLVNSKLIETRYYFRNSEYNPNIFYSNLEYYNNQLFITIPFEGVFKIEKNKMVEIPLNFEKEYFNAIFFKTDKELFLINRSFIHHNVIQKNNILKLNQNNKFEVVELLKNKIVNDFIRTDNNTYCVDSEGYIYLNGLRRYQFDFLKNNIFKFKFLRINDKVYFYDKKQLFQINNTIIKQKIIVKSLNESYYRNVRSRRKIIVSKDSIFFFGNPNPILYHDGKYKFLEKFKHSVYDALKIKNRYYLATEGDGVIVSDLINYEKIINLNTTEKYFTSLFLDKNKLFIGGIDFLYQYDINSRLVVKYKNPFLGYSIKAINKQDDNNLIVGTDNGLYIQNLKTLKTNKISKLNGNLIGDILLDKEKIYIGHENGIDVLDLSLKRIEKINFPLSNNPRICSLNFDSKGNILASSYTGIFIYNPNTKKTIYLTQNTGLVNEEFNYKSVAPINKNTFIFGGLDGYDIIQTNEVFSLVKDKIKGNYSGYDIIGSNKFNHKNIIDKEISFNRDKEYIKIYFPLINTIDNNIHVNVILNNDTIETNSAYYNLIGLKEGKYDFKVLATSKNNHKIEFSNLKIIVTESFFKSKMFIISVSFVLIIILISYTLTIIKLKSKQKQNYQKISMDLHDDIGGLLCKSKLILGYDELDDNRKNMLIKFIDQANFNLRIFINDIESKKRLLNDIEYQINEIFNQDLLIQKNSKLDLIFNLSQAYYVKSNLYRDIKFILYEISNNFFKHSNSESISVEFVVISKVLYINMEKTVKLTTTFQSKLTIDFGAN